MPKSTLRLQLMRQPAERGNVSSIQLVSTYVLIGSLWLIVFNQVLDLVVRNVNTLNILTTLGNLGFVIVTGWFMYRLSLRTQRNSDLSRTQDLALLEKECYLLREKVFQQSDELFHLQGILQRKSSTNPNSSEAGSTDRISVNGSHQPNPQAVQELQHAIANREFILEYQPIVMLNHGNRIIGFEALVRWQHPHKGLIMPGDFIPFAEETDLIVPLGEWVLEEACRQNERWRQQFPGYENLMVSVNLSSKQFNQPDLVNQIAAVLEKTGLPPSCLKLEITETAIMQDAETAIAMLTKLHNMGVKLSIDDFGTGYSSLSYLYRFPVDSLKVDRSFISRIDHDGEQVELVRTILTLAWNLGLSTIAEGIENPKQMAQLRALHCECGQGFFFSKPLSRQAVDQLLSDQIDRL
ncbi:MAG: EAL domain-containing protein [Synechococcales cyanobacterium T60_A2020_003]|nr:EAL domain-containing protein [Synechococcales cyanobacterium T60_A2020_003]